MTDDDELALNKVFDSIGEVNQIIYPYAKRNGFTFIKGHTQGNLKEMSPEHFPYSSIDFTCERFGKPRFRGTGTRQTKSKKCDCQVSVRLTLSKNQYKITHLHLQHNHDLIQDSNSNTISDCEETSKPAKYNKKSSMPTVAEEAKSIIQDKVDESPLDNFAVSEVEGEGVPEVEDEVVSEVQDKVSYQCYPEKAINGQSIQEVQNINQTRTVNSKLQNSESLELPHNHDSISDLTKQLEDAINKLHAIQRAGEILDVEILKKLQNNLSRLIDLNASRLSEIKLVETKSRGRPKGTDSNAIGLKYKKMSKEFEKRTRGQQLISIIEWFMLSNAKKSNLIDLEYKLTKNDVKEKQESKLLQHFLDIPCDLNILQNHMEEDAYNYFVSLVAKKKKKEEYECGICGSILNDDCIQCESCLIWFEFTCVGIKKGSSNSWFCEHCIQMFSENIDKYE